MIGPDPLFSLFFVLIVIAVIVSFVLKIIGVFESGNRGVNSSSSQGQPEVRETEVIREIVKIKCPYCGQLYDQMEGKCPNCGARNS
jgi:cell division protein FtsN